MWITPAYAQGSPGGGGFELFIPIALMFVIMYVLLIRPQQKRMKQHKEMVANVRRGDTVVTSGGVIGKVVKVEDEELQVEIAQGVRVKVVKGTLSEVRAKGQPAKGENAKK